MLCRKLAVEKPTFPLFGGTWSKPFLPGGSFSLKFQANFYNGLIFWVFLIQWSYLYVKVLHLWRNKKYTVMHYHTCFQQTFLSGCWNSLTSLKSLRDKKIFPAGSACLSLFRPGIREKLFGFNFRPAFNWRMVAVWESPTSVAETPAK